MKNMISLHILALLRIYSWKLSQNHHFGVTNFTYKTVQPMYVCYDGENEKYMYEHKYVDYLSKVPAIVLSW